MRAELEVKIKNYFDAKRIADEAKAQVEFLGAELKELLNKEGITKDTTSNGFEVSLIDSTIFKYVDELAIRDYLRQNNLNEYLVESIDTKRLNESLKKSNELSNDLSKYVMPSISTRLQVKESK